MSIQYLKIKRAKPKNTAASRQLQDDWDKERRSSLVDKEALRDQIAELEKKLSHTEAKLQSALEKLSRYRRSRLHQSDSNLVLA